jgi:hypothetical protein
MRKIIIGCSERTCLFICNDKRACNHPCPIIPKDVVNDDPIRNNCLSYIKNEDKNPELPNHCKACYEPDAEKCVNFCPLVICENRI